MTILRQGRWLQGSFFSGSASLLTATAVLGFGLLVPRAGATIPHTHGRHPLPTALHTLTVADTEAHSAGKRPKAAVKGKAGARSAGATAAPGTSQHRSSKKGKGRGRRAEPVDDPVPMFRADRSAHAHAAQTASGKRGGNSRRGAFYDQPAPLVSSWRHGSHETKIAGHSERVAASVVSAHASRTALPPAHDPARRAASQNEVATVMRRPAAAAPHRTEVFAQGVSRPDDDERASGLRNAENTVERAESAAPAPIVRASAAASVSSMPIPAAQPAVVQGFGGEVAVPSSSVGDRPGGTRRRSHPSGWTPESLVTQPEPLEEREAITLAAVSPAVIPEIYDRNGRLLMPAPLKGSHDVLVHQNLMANSDGLERIQDDADLDRLRAAHLLVSFPVNESLRLNEDLPANRRVARPWAVLFAADMAHGFYAQFHQPLQVNSAVRTVHYQAHLQMVNGNAAATYGEAASPHLTGQAIDIGKRGMSHAELAWMRDYLMPLMQAGKIDVEEEFQQACFHISVYRSYAAGRPAIRHEVAQVHPVVTSTVGTADAESPDEQ